MNQLNVGAIILSRKTNEQFAIISFDGNKVFTVGVEEFKDNKISLNGTQKTISLAHLVSRLYSKDFVVRCNK